MPYRGTPTRVPRTPVWYPAWCPSTVCPLCTDHALTSTNVRVVLGWVLGQVIASPVPMWVRSAVPGYPYACPVPTARDAVSGMGGRVRFALGWGWTRDRVRSGGVTLPLAYSPFAVGPCGLALSRGGNERAS